MRPGKRVSTWRSRRRRLLVLLTAATATLIAAGCASSGTAGSTASGTGLGNGDAASQFATLVAQAKASNHQVAVPLTSQSSAQIADLEKAFQTEFGFPLDLVNVPGHASLVFPTKVVAAAQEGKAVADVTIDTGLYYTQVMFDDGTFRKPDWAAVESKWPSLAQLRTQVEPNLTNKDGQQESEYALPGGVSPYVVLYNTKKLSASEISGFTWASMADPKWKGDIAIDETGGIIAYYAMVPGVSYDQYKSFVNAVAQNKPIAVTGGSTGVAQAVVSGQAEAGITSLLVAQKVVTSGAPVAIYWAPVSPTQHYLPEAQEADFMVTPTLDNPSMAELFWAWYGAVGIYSIVPDGGLQRADPAESAVFPLVKQVQEAGFSTADFVQPTDTASTKVFAEAVTYGGDVLTGNAP
jgi:ABC-type Fe3+ transport system substrate-binding protein